MVASRLSYLDCADHVGEGRLAFLLVLVASFFADTVQVDGMGRNGRTACSGISGRHASESVDDMRRNPQLPEDAAQLPARACRESEEVTQPVTTIR